MKRLWSALAIIAVANMLALAAFVAWLAAADRLDLARARELRAMFTETLTQRAERLKTERAEEEARLARAEEVARQSVPPLTAAEIVRAVFEEREAGLERQTQWSRNLAQVMAMISAAQGRLEQELQRLDQDRAEFERERAKVANTEGAAQFRKTLATYEQLKPDKAKAALSELILAGEKDQVVAYLNAMQERTRTRIIEEFVKEDPRLASELLERLRLRGLAPLAGSLSRAGDDPPRGDGG